MMINKKIKSLVLLAMVGTFFHVSAQNAVSVISGTVEDIYGNPLPGVIISSADKKNIYITDSEGKYSVKMDINNEKLTYTLIGYKAVTKDVNDDMKVVLEDDAHATAEVINLGYTKQSREVLSNAVSTVSGAELEKSLMSRLQGSFSGQLSGLTTIESSFEPTNEDVSMYIRGFSTFHGGTAGIVIDGILYDQYSHDILYRISPEEVESITVLKDGASQALYGLRGAKGIIVITTKRGTPGKLKLGVNISETLEQPSYKPTFINSATYAGLRNQAAYNDGLGKNYYYSDEQVEKFRAGDDPLYPNTNWYNMLMRNYSHMQRVGVDATGGTDVVRYYADVNMTHQGGFWHTDQDEYNANNDRYKFNLRTNIDVNINKYIGAYVNMAGNITRAHNPMGTNSSIYSLMLYMPSTLYGPVTPEVKDNEGNITDKGGEVTTTTNIGISPYGELNRRGYSIQTNTNIYAQAGLNFDLSFLTPGLSISGGVGYLSYITATMSTSQSYARYDRDEDWSKLSFTQHGTTLNTDLSYGKSTALYGYMSYKGEANYVRDFGLHHVKANAFGIYQELDDNTGNVGSTYRFKRIYSGLEAQYDYDKRYALKLDIGLSGSDFFPSGHRFLTTPGVSLAWIASNESFIKDNVSWLTMLKPRVSYAITGNDEYMTSYFDYRYDYMDQVQAGQGGAIGWLGYYTNEKAYGNPNLEPEKIKKGNIGIDLGLFNQLTLSFDMFKEKMDNGIYRSTALIPGYQGIALDAFPSTNFAEYENKGYEFELNYTKRFDKDWSANLGGFVSYNENKIINVGETPYDDTYAYKYRTEGYPLGQRFGYLVDYSNGNGMYNFQDEIDAGPTYSFGTPRVGDLKFKDINGDGTIDEKDQAPIGNGSLPRYYYGINAGFTYKNFELSLLFQGVADYSTNYGGLAVNESLYDGEYCESHLNAWTEERWLNDEKITYPALSTSKSASAQTNDFFEKNTSFCRLKNAELSYTLPKNISKAIGANSFKIILGGQNLFTIDKMDTNDMPVEGSYFMFPIYRMYRIGISAKF